MRNKGTRTNTIVKFFLIIGITFTLFLFTCHIQSIEASSDFNPVSYGIEGFAKYSTGEDAVGASVEITSSLGTVTTTVISGGFWQIDVGSLSGPSWSRGTNFDVAITIGDWLGTGSGTVSTDPNVFFSDMGTIMLFSSISLLCSVSAEPISGVVPLTVSFIGSVSGDSDSYLWSWDFGDGNTSHEQSPIYTFYEMGVYIVELMVTDEYGTSASDIITISVEASSSDNGNDTTHPVNGHGLIIVATVDKNMGIPGELFTFDARGSDAQEGDIVAYTWDFGDGTVISTNESMITHLFDAVGLYPVMLTIENDLGETGMLDEPLIINIVQEIDDPGCLVVTPEATGTHQNTSVMFTMMFTGSDVNDTVRFEIDWDDGSTVVSDYVSSGELFTISHQWNKFGVYTIIVIVYDEDDVLLASSTMTMSVDVLVIDDVINGWLIDSDSDGSFDVFKNLVTSENTTVEVQDEGRYLIDSSNDGKWDFRYCETEGLSEFKEGSFDDTPGLTLAVILFGLFIGIIFCKRKT